MNAERLGAIFWLAFGLIVMFASFRLELGTLRTPGSGFLGFLGGGFVTLMALVVLVQSCLKQSKPHTMSSLWKGLKWWRPLAMALLVLFYILSLERLGFIVTSLFFLLATFRGVVKFSWPRAGWVTCLVVGCSYLLFHVFLKATLPRGMFGF